MQKRFGWTVLTLGLLLGQGCGDKHAPTAPSSTGNSTGTSKASIRAIEIGGASGITALNVGETRQLNASAQLADGSSEDITPLVAWSSADTSVAAITPSGLVTAVGPGMGRIRASYGGATGESTFAVVKNTTDGKPTDNRDDSGGGSSSGSGGTGTGGGGSGSGSGGSGTGTGTGLQPTVQSITITGDHNVPVGKNAQFRAIAHMSDGSERDVTAGSTWTSDNSMIGSISQSGWFLGIVPGSNVVRADYNGNTASQPVQVTPL